MSPKMTYFLQSSALVSPHNFFLNIKLPFWDIDGSTPTHSPKSGWDNSDVFPGGFASCLGITLMSFLVVLPPVLG